MMPDTEFCRSDALLKAQHELDESIEHRSQIIKNHSRMVVDLRRRRNKLALVLILPNEILSDIFAQYVRDRFTYIQSIGGIIYRWVEIMHICHHWREVALSIPYLWSFITSADNLEYVQELLARSKQTSLNVSLQRSNSQITREALQLIFSHFHRMSVIKVALPDLQEVR